MLHWSKYVSVSPKLMKYLLFGGVVVVVVVVASYEDEHWWLYSKRAGRIKVTNHTAVFIVM